MTWFTLVLVLSMVLCTVCATIRMTHFTLQPGKTAKQISTQLQIVCSNKTVRTCAVKCATNPNCLSFSSGKMSVWVRERWTPSVPPDIYDNKRFNTSSEQEHKHKDECLELPRLQHGKWQRLKKTDSAQTVSVICNNRPASSSNQREIACDKAREHWRTIDSDCKTGIWTYIDVSTNFGLPFKLLDLRGIVIKGTFHHKFTVYLHNSKMPSFKLKFILRTNKVEIILLPRGKHGVYSTPLINEAPKPGKQFMLAISVRDGYLRFRLSRGDRTCPTSVPGFPDGVDKLVLENPDTIEIIRIYFK